jgi:hypothetical protein
MKLKRTSFLIAQFGIQGYIAVSRVFLRRRRIKLGYRSILTKQNKASHFEIYRGILLVCWTRKEPLKRLSCEERGKLPTR